MKHSIANNAKPVNKNERNNKKILIDNVDKFSQISNKESLDWSKVQYLHSQRNMKQLIQELDMLQTQLLLASSYKRFTQHKICRNRRTRSGSKHKQSG